MTDGLVMNGARPTDPGATQPFAATGDEPTPQARVRAQAATARLAAPAISAWFGSPKVLGRVSLSMRPGGVTALIGPSGCGKSTFLRILNRMHEMTRGASLAGEVLLGGDDIYRPDWLPQRVRQRIGMVFQKPN